MAVNKLASISQPTFKKSYFSFGLPSVTIMKDYKPEYYRYLPHFQPSGVIFFITGRLFDSFPKEVLKRLKEEKEMAYRRILKDCKEVHEQKEAIRNLHRAHFARWDGYLDSNQSEPLWLKNGQVAAIVKQAFHYFDGQSYDLVAYTIMPNHFHLIIDVLDEVRFTKPLYRIMHSIKSFTAKEANKVLKREGSFWQEESYDHIIRNDRELKNTIAYVLENPVKAGLVADWQAYLHSYVNEKYL